MEDRGGSERGFPSCLLLRYFNSMKWKGAKKKCIWEWFQSTCVKKICFEKSKLLFGSSGVCNEQSYFILSYSHRKMTQQGNISCYIRAAATLTIDSFLPLARDLLRIIIFLSLNNCNGINTFWLCFLCLKIWIFVCSCIDPFILPGHRCRQNPKIYQITDVLLANFNIS